MTDMSTLENLYRRGVLDYNPKDYLTGSSSDIVPNPNRDIFIPDNRFARVDGSYIRQQIDRDLLELNRENKTGTTSNNQNKKENNFFTKVKNLLWNKITAGIVGLGSFILAGRYLLKKIHILK